MVEETLSSSPDSNLPDVSRLNILDQESTFNNPRRETSIKRKPPRMIGDEKTAGMQRKEVCLGFPDSIYTHAADIFQKTHVEKEIAKRLIDYRSFSPNTAGDEDEDEDEDDVNDGVDAGILREHKGIANEQNELWAYELAFNTLKFQDLLEEILTDSFFYRSQQVSDDLMILVMVVFYDLLDRKFQHRESIFRGETDLIKEVRQVEDSLCRFKTKLEASLAQYRIKQNLLTIHSFLPMAVRDKHRWSKTLPLYAWVNTLTTSTENICETLTTTGFAQVDSPSELLGNVFCKDKHCSNVLLFPRRLKGQLEKSELVTEHMLIVQDKSRSLAACAVFPLLTEGADVLMVGSFSAQTVAHVAVKAAACSGCVHVCGVLNIHSFNKELAPILSSSGCTNVKLISETFGELYESDTRVQKIRVIVLLPKCSMSALCNPVEFMLNEGGDRALLHGLSRGTVSHSKLQALVDKQRQDLNRALSLPKVKAVVYCTCSVYPEENEDLVKRAIENADSKAKALPFKLVSTGWHDEKEHFFRTEENDVTNGCFLCVMKREQDPAEVETVQDILARAAAKGLLGGLMPPDPLTGEKPKKRKKQKGMASLHPMVEPPVTVMISPPAPISLTDSNPNTTSRILNDSITDDINISATTIIDDSNIHDQTNDLQEKPSKARKHRAKVSKQSKRKKVSKSKLQTRTLPPHKKVQKQTKATPPLGKPVRKSILTPRSLQSRAGSKRATVKAKTETIKEIQIRELSLPPVYPLSSSSSNSPYRLYSSNVSDFSSTPSSSSSISKTTSSTGLQTSR